MIPTVCIFRTHFRKRYVICEVRYDSKILNISDYLHNNVGEHHQIIWRTGGVEMVVIWNVNTW